MQKDWASHSKATQPSSTPNLLCAEGTDWFRVSNTWPGIWRWESSVPSVCPPSLLFNYLAILAWYLLCMHWCPPLSISVMILVVLSIENYPKFMSHMNKTVATAQLSWLWAWFEKKRTDPQQRKGWSHTTLGISRQYNGYATNTCVDPGPKRSRLTAFSSILLLLILLLPSDSFYLSTNKTAPMHHFLLCYHYNCKTKAGPSANTFYGTLSKPVYLHGQETHPWSHLAVDHVLQPDQPSKICPLLQQWHNYLGITNSSVTGLDRMEYLVL